MVLLIFNNQLFDNSITRPPTNNSPEPETRSLRAPHNNQSQTRTGLHDEIRQDIGIATVQTNQDIGTVYTGCVPPHLKRKLLMCHDDRTIRTRCNSKVSSGGKMAVLAHTSMVSDDGDWIHSDYNDDDKSEDEVQRQQQQQQQLGLGIGPSWKCEFPPWVGRHQRKHLRMQEMAAAMKCTRSGCRHDGDDDTRKVTATAVVLARPQIHPRSGKRKRDDTETISESYNRNSNSNDALKEDESTRTRKRQRVGSSPCRGIRSATAPPAIQRVEGIYGTTVNADGAYEVAQPPITITRHLSEESFLSVGPRRSRRIREKLGSACGQVK